MVITALIVAGKDLKINPINSFFIYNTDVLKGNVTSIEETFQGFNIYCKLNITRKKLRELKKALKANLGAESVNATVQYTKY